MRATLATARVMGIEKKDRVLISARIEREFHDMISRHHLELSDFVNISLQRLINSGGVPLFLVSIGDGDVRMHPLESSDVINIAVGSMLAEKGYLIKP